MAVLGNSNDLFYKPTTQLVTGLGSDLGRNTQNFPDTLTGLAGLCGYMPSAIYKCQETSGDMFNQAAGGALLDFSTDATNYSVKTVWGSRKALRTSKDNGGYLIRYLERK